MTFDGVSRIALDILANGSSSTLSTREKQSEAVNVLKEMLHKL